MRALFLAGAALLLMSSAGIAQTLSQPSGTVAIIGAGSQVQVRLVSSGATDTATDTITTTIKWTSTTASAKAETLPTCGAGNKAQTFTVKDGANTAATYPITITAPSSTFDGAASYILNVNRLAVAVQCDGNGDWSIQ